MPFSVAPPETIAVVDHGTVLTIPFEACVAYHGYTSIGGVALGFRLMQYAVERLSPDSPPDREAIRVFTTFPGPGLRDAVELITRAVTRKAYTADATVAVAAPEGVTGRMYFEVTIGDQTLYLALIEGGISPEFIALGRRHKTGEATAEDRARWTVLKEKLATDILAARPADLFVDLPARPDAV